MDPLVTSERRNRGAIPGPAGMSAQLLMSQLTQGKNIMNVNKITIHMDNGENLTVTPLGEGCIFSGPFRSARFHPTRNCYGLTFEEWLEGIERALALPIECNFTLHRKAFSIIVKPSLTFEERVANHTQLKKEQANDHRNREDTK